MEKTIKLGATDRFFLKMEARDTPAHTASLSIFRLPDSAPRDFLQRLFAKLRAQPVKAPPFTYVLAEGRTPAWKVLEPGEIDIDYHIRHSALPWPGGERELGQLVSRLHAHQLDFARPLWEFHLIEGLENNRFATYMKMHHALADGGAVIKILTDSLSTTPDAPSDAPWARTIAPLPERPAKLPDLTDNPSVTTLLRALARTALSARDRPETGLVGPFVAPPSAINGRVTAARRYATQQLSLSRLKLISKTTETSVNDVFLCLVSGALRRYLSEIDALPSRPLVTNVPVALDRESEDGLGNAVTIIYATLATNVADPLERLRIISDSTARGKAFIQRLSAKQANILNAVTFVPLIVANSFGVGAAPRRPIANLPISNVPGPRHRLWLEGAEVEAFYPCSMLPQGYPLNVTARGYHDTVNIGFLGARDALPHFQHLAVYTGEALNELENALGIKEVEKRSAA